MQLKICLRKKFNQIANTIDEMFSHEERAELARFDRKHRDIQVRLDMVEEIDHELVAALGKRARHDRELRDVLDVVDLTAKVLRSDLAATNEAIGKLITKSIGCKTHITS